MTSYLGLLALAALFGIFGYVSGTWRHRDDRIRRLGFAAMGLLGVTVVIEIMVGISDTTMVAPGAVFVTGVFAGFLLILPGLYWLLIRRN